MPALESQCLASCPYGFYMCKPPVPNWVSCYLKSDTHRSPSSPSSEQEQRVVLSFSLLFVCFSNQWIDSVFPQLELRNELETVWLRDAMWLVKRFLSSRVWSIPCCPEVSALLSSAGCETQQGWELPFFLSARGLVWMGGGGDRDPGHWPKCICSQGDHFMKEKRWHLRTQKSSLLGLSGSWGWSLHTYPT